MLELLQPSIPQSNSSAPKDPECKVRTQWPMWNMNTLEYRSSAWQPNLESKTGTSLRASCFSHTGAQVLAAVKASDKAIRPGAKKQANFAIGRSFLSL